MESKSRNYSKGAVRQKGNDRELVKQASQDTKNKSLSIWPSGTWLSTVSFVFADLFHSLQRQGVVAPQLSLHAALHVGVRRVALAGERLLAGAGAESAEPDVEGGFVLVVAPDVEGGGAGAWLGGLEGDGEGGGFSGSETGGGGRGDDETEIRSN